MTSFLEQRTWRLIGGGSIIVAAGMAWYGVEHMIRDIPIVILSAYWGLFLVLFLVAIYMVLLDLRYIRMQHVLAERDLYLKTIADEAVRDALSKAIGQTPSSPSKTDEE